MGTTHESYVKFSQRIDRKTGGVGVSTYLSERFGQPEPAARFLLSAKATVAQVPDLLAILREMLLTVNLDDRERFRQIVLKTKARFESSLIPGGHAYVRNRLHAGLTTAGWVEEQMEGIEGLFFVRRLVDQVENEWPTVLASLQARDELPDIDVLRERFAPRTPAMPDVQVELPPTSVYDELLEAV